MKKIALVLSGCGNKDGAEITEAVSLLIALSQCGAQVSAFAPDIEFDAIDFIQQKTMNQKRNAMTEAARIMRGQVQDLKNLNVKDFDAIAFAGGYGVVKNLCNWADKGARCEVLPEVEKAIIGFYEASKPIGAVCIAPALIARVLGKKQITVTVGEKSEAAKEIEKTGAIHEVCPVDDFITDREHKIVSTPAYMYDAEPHQVFKGIHAMAKELVEWA